MKNTLKRTISILLAITILVLINVPSFAATKPPNITIKLNDLTLTLDAKPININGRILVPVASLAKELGATVDWISDTKSVVVTLQTKEKKRTIYLKIGQASALVNCMEVELDCSPVIYNNRTFVPLRFISENFGATIKWNGKTKTVSITYNVPVQQKPPILPLPWELPGLQTTGSAITVNN